MKSEPKLTFGQKIVATREEMGMKPAEFARLLGIQRQLVAQWEKKERCSIDANNLALLVNKTGKPQEYWLDRSAVGTPLVDELEDSLAELSGPQAQGEVGMDDPKAQLALSLLTTMPVSTAIKVINEAFTRLSAQSKGKRSVPTHGA